ncbi:hypothetical protein AAY473_015249 [Plecturocebus cupreus]
MPVVPATREAEAGELLEPENGSCSEPIAPLHSSLKTGFHHVGRMVSISCPGDLPTSVSQSAGITGVSHSTCLGESFEEGKKHDLKEWADPLSSGVQDQPGQHGETLFLQKHTKISWVWWHMPIVPATWEANVRGFLELGRRRLECAKITALHSNLSKRAYLELLASSDPAPVSQSARTTDMKHCAWLSFIFSMLHKMAKTDSCCAVLACVELLASSDPPTSASQSVGIIDISHYVEPVIHPPQPPKVLGLQNKPLHPAIIDCCKRKYKKTKAHEGYTAQDHIASKRQHSGRPRQEDHLSVAVQDQPGQHSKFSPLLKKKKKKARHCDTCLWSQLPGRLRWEDCLSPVV